MPLIPDFFRDMDRLWKRSTKERVSLRIIGSSALMLQTGYERGTKDSDVLETAGLTQDIKAQLLAIAGQDTALARSTGSTSTSFPLKPALRSSCSW